MCLAVFLRSLYDLGAGDEIYNTSKLQICMKPHIYFPFTVVLLAGLCGPFSRRGGKKWWEVTFEVNF